MPPPAPFPWIDVLIILALVVLNGLFAMSELAIVSARTARLEALARTGRRGAATALLLREDPGKFLSTVQIGITLIAILSGAYSGEALGGPVAERLALLGVPARHAGEAGLALVIAATTYVSLIAGELVPKQLALRAPESIATVAAPIMAWLARATAPVVWLLDQTSALVFRLLRLQRDVESHVTAEELQLIVAEASSAGVIEESERAIISGVVRLADRPVREVMTPRPEVYWIDADASLEEVREAVLESPHSRLPVAEGSVDAILGVVSLRDILGAMLEGRPVDLRAMAQPVPAIPDRMDAMDALTVLRDAPVPLALVHDEYGHLDGLVTPASLLAAIAGVFASDRESGDDPELVEREDGSLLVSGALSADALAERIGLTLPEDRDYATVAGLVLAALRRIPDTGDHFEMGGWRIEVVDMDGRRVDKLLVAPAPSAS
ncbi:hemolysin family protein [Sphingomonas morindae]|uniref:Hemolysin family protein n=1 Tax=Sphingomonas morindae TaxID=1541170 RepID=A0ABY4X8T9_9SPHN|nr:hemolysin family protein [Sphingomonas morindae]USI73331.1 hemolysin family protein [Sphingomonas morindae]